MEGSAAPQPNPKTSDSVLDVRGLKAPDNVLAVLAKASGLNQRGNFDFLIDSNPFQLYDLLQQRGYALEMTPQSDGTYLGRASLRDLKALAR